MVRNLFRAPHRRLTVSSPAGPDVRLTLLGVPRLLRADGSVHPVQRLRMALLALIAVSGRQGVPRESLLGLLWPERDPESARHALEQALYALRRDHGADLVVGTDPLRLGPSVACDVPEFEAALKDEAWSVAIDRYGGPLLQGLHVKDSPAFEQWLDWERERLSAGYRRALAARGEAAEDAGDLAAAVASWQLYTREDPLSPIAAAGLVRSLGASGQTASARNVVEGWERLVRSELGGDPDPRVRAALRVAVGPDRVPAPAPPPRAPAPAVLDPPVAVAPDLAVPAQSPAGRRRWWLVLPAVVALGIGVWGVAEWRGRAGSVIAPQRDLLIAPVRITTSDSAVEAVGRTLQGMIATRFEGDAAGSLPPIGSVGTPWRLDGSVSGDRSALVLEFVVRHESDRMAIARAQVTGSLAEFGRMVDEGLARLLVATASSRFGESGAASLGAVQSFLLGLRRYAERDVHAAIAALRHALVLDSTLAPAALLLRRASLDADGSDVARATRLAWNARDRLSRADHDLVLAIVGADFPGRSPPIATLERLRQHVAGHLHHPDGWYELGSFLYAHGHALGQADPWGEAQSALERAIALDSLLAHPARRALVEMAALVGDTGLLTRAGLADEGNTDDDRRWRAWLAAFTARDTATLRTLRPELASLDTTRLLMARALALRAGFDVVTAREATRMWAERARTGPERSDAAGYQYRLALNLGQPGEARRHASGMLREWSEPDRQAYLALASTWWGGDPDDGAAAALAAVAPGGEEAADPGTRGGQAIRRCAAEQFRVVRLGELGGATTTARQLRQSAPGTPDWVEATLEGCALFLEGMAASRTAPARARAFADSLDRWQREGSTGSWAFPEVLATATLWATLGEWSRASAVLARRSPRQVRFLNTTLRLATEAAFQAGDTLAARRAATHYLALMEWSEPSHAADVARARTVLGQVVTER